MATDISIDVSGQMDPIIPDQPKKPTLYSLLTIPPQLPDPKEYLLQQKQNIRPWLVFLQTSNFKTPPSMMRLGKRIMRNIEYFQANYVFVFLGLIVYCLITSPLVLLAIVGSFYIGYRLNQRHTIKKFRLFGKELTIAQLYGLVALGSMPIYYIVGAHGAMFWVLGVSFFLITLHAAFYNIDAILNHNNDDLPLLLEQI